MKRSRFSEGALFTKRGVWRNRAFSARFWAHQGPRGGRCRRFRL